MLSALEVVRNFSTDLPVVMRLHEQVSETGEILSKEIYEQTSKRNSLFVTLEELHNPYNPDNANLSKKMKRKIETDIKNSIFEINKSMYTVIEHMIKATITTQMLKDNIAEEIIKEKLRLYSTKFIEDRIYTAAKIKANLIDDTKSFYKDKRFENLSTNKGIFIHSLAIYDLERYEKIIQITLNHFAQRSNPLITPIPGEF